MTRHEPKLLHKGLLAVRRNTIRRLLNTVFGIQQLRDGQREPLGLPVRVRRVERHVDLHPLRS